MVCLLLPNLVWGMVDSQLCTRTKYSIMYLVKYCVWFAMVLQSTSVVDPHCFQCRSWSRVSFSSQCVSAYLTTSGFWPRVRARALRAPVFLSSLPSPNGALRAPSPRPSIWIRIWIQGAKPMPIYADPDPGQTLKSQKVEFTKIGLFVNFGQFPCSWIRIRILNTDPYPGQPNQCGSGSGRESYLGPIGVARSANHLRWIRHTPYT